MAYRRTERVESRLAERRKAMLDAARALLLEHGYAGASMQAVARRADTSIGNLYFYFAHKDQLLEAVVDELLDEITTRADALCDELPKGPAWVAGATYAGTLAVFEQRALCARVLADPGASTLRARALAHFVERFEGRLTERPGLVRGTDAKLLSLAVQGATFHTIESQLASNASVRPRELARFLARFALRALGLDAREVEATLELVEAAIPKHPRRTKSPPRTKNDDER